PVYAWDGRRQVHRWSWADVPRLLALGVLCLAGNQVLFLIGLERTTATHAALMFGLSPIQVLLIAAALRQESITPRKLLGMLVALSGVMVLQSSGPEGAGGATLVGDLLVFAGALGFSLFAVFGKQSTATHGAITVNTFAYVGGGSLLTPVIIGVGSGFEFSSVSATGWLGLFYMALFPSVVCYIIFYYALTYV
ncbi:MAG: EamA family transporter, partial [bacterium]|nr:EamA family transporter [bacterium]